MRAPANPTEQAAMVRAYESADPFAIARWERPGCRYLRVVDQRSPGRRAAHFPASFVLAVPAGDDAPGALLPDEQTITLTDADAPTIAAIVNRGA